MFWILPYSQPLLGLAWIAGNILIYRKLAIRPAVANEQGRQARQNLDFADWIQNNIKFFAFVIHLMIAFHLMGADELGRDLSRGFGVSDMLNSLRPNFYPDLFLYFLEEKFSLILGVLLAVLYKKRVISLEALFFIAFGITVYTFVLRENIVFGNNSATGGEAFERNYQEFEIPKSKPEATDFYKKSEKHRKTDANQDTTSNIKDPIPSLEENEEKKAGFWEILFEIIAFILDVLA